MIILIFSLALAILLESVVLSLPLTIVVLLFASIFLNKDRSLIFLLAFLSGLILDIFNMRLLGTSSLFFVTFVFFVFLYQRKFETDTFHFFGSFTFLGSITYLLFTGSSYVTSQSVVLTIISIVSYYIYKRIGSKKKLSYF